jgi:cytochrome b
MHMNDKQVVSETRQVRVWDPLVRLFHWSLVVSFIVAYFTGEEESLVHVYAGYFIIGLLVFRIVWGFIGARHARFSDFLYSPRRTLGYLKRLLAGQPEHYTGHNPAGGWMIVALLVALALTSWTGLKVYGLEGYGPLAGNGMELSLVASAQADDEHEEREGREDHEEYENGEEHEGTGEHEGGEEAEEFWEELHEFFANFTVLLIFVHVAGVIVASRLHGENLVRAMITGRKNVS